MFKFENGALRIQQFEDAPVDIDILKDQKESYKKYKEETIQRDVSYLSYVITKHVFNWRKNITAVAHVEELYPKFDNEISKRTNRYYPVAVDFYADEILVAEKVPLLRIPYLDDYCVLNVNGSQKSLINVMSRAPDVTYDKKKSEVVVNMSNDFFKLRLKDRASKIYFTMRGSDLTLDAIIYAFQVAYGDNTNVNELFTNPYIKNALASSMYTTDIANRQEIMKSRMLANLLPTYDATADRPYADTGTLGPLRDALNKRLSLDACVSRVLSRPIGSKGFNVAKGTDISQDIMQQARANGLVTLPIEICGKVVDAPIDACECQVIGRDVVQSDFYIPAGTAITTEMIRKMKLHRINEVYVKAKPSIVGKKVAQDIAISKLPQGTKITELVQEIVPELENDMSFILAEEIVLDDTYVIKDKTKLKSDHIQLLFDCGLEEVICYRKSDTKGGKIKYRFEQEFIGNYTAMAKDLVSNPMELTGKIKGTDWVYYKYNPDVKTMDESNCPDYFTVDDIYGIISLSGRLFDGDEYGEAQDVDLDFYKKVDMANEIFSKYFRATANDFVRKWKTNIQRMLSMSDKVNNSDVFKDFTHNMLSKIMKESLLRTSKDQTPISIITQANKIVTPTADSDSVSEGQRMLALGFYGKIDPNDVPQGKNIGLVNTATACTRIVNGVMTAPYLKLFSKSDGTYIINKEEYIVWLNAEQERSYVIGDRALLQTDKNGKILNKYALARVPSPEDKDEKVKVALAAVKDIQYVNAIGEETLSAGVQVMPFACSNDAVRVNFGTSLFMNCIYVASGQAPWVVTDMYNHMLSYSNEFRVRAEDSGYIVEIRPNQLKVRYDSAPGDTIYKLNETKLFNECVLSMNYKKAEGERFEKGDVLVDTPVSSNGIFSPGRNIIAAYLIWGYNYEDALTVGITASYDFTSIGMHKVSLKVPKEKKYIPTNKNKFKYVRENTELDTVYTSSAETGEDTGTTEWRSSSSGIVYDITTEYSEAGSGSDKSLVAKLLSFNKLKAGDKMSGRHGNKGATARLEENSNMPTLYNGVVTQILLNPLGINSRMNPGQNKDAMLGLCGYLLQTQIYSNSFNGASIEEIHYLLKFVHEIANAVIKDDYLYSFYRTNSRVLIELTRQVDDILVDLKICEEEAQRLVSIVDTVKTNDIGKVYTSLLANQDALEQAHPDRINQIRHLASSAMTVAKSINTTMTCLSEGIEELKEKLSKSTETVHKNLLSNLAAIERQEGSSPIYKNLQTLAAISAFLRQAAVESLAGITYDFKELPVEIIEKAYSRFWAIKEYENCFFSDGTALLYNPETGMPFEGHVALGVPYFLKIVQEVDEKTGARSGMLQEVYSALEHQAPQGASRGGGQRTGEMELAALLAHGAADLVYEIYNVCSDNDGARLEEYCNALGIDTGFINRDQCHPKTVDLFRYILEGMCIQLKISNYPDISRKTVSNFIKVKGRTIFKQYLKETRRDLTGANEVAAEAMGMQQHILDNAGASVNKNISDIEKLKGMR